MDRDSTQPSPLLSASSTNPSIDDLAFSLPRREPLYLGDDVCGCGCANIIDVAPRSNLRSPRMLKPSSYSALPPSALPRCVVCFFSSPRRLQNPWYRSRVKNPTQDEECDIFPYSLLAYSAADAPAACQRVRQLVLINIPAAAIIPLTLPSTQVKALQIACRIPVISSAIAVNAIQILSIDVGPPNLNADLMFLDLAFIQQSCETDLVEKL
ncbi:hypothetical protein R3P38DRAFT_3179309 [Favolaschia claudopus]|uniref:Uncharacterized protein n=1 Tax=Favolaschia claudopus TaxID=2862362 RepID=A0AAW0CWZ9_9AGAR